MSNLEVWMAGTCFVLLILLYGYLEVKRLDKIQVAGMDENFARKQKWWEEIENLVETDDATTKNLVENIYLNVCDAKLGELNFATNTLMETRDIETTLQRIAKRQAQIEHFAKIENLKEVQSDK